MNRAATLALSPLGFLYGVTMKARASLFRHGVFRTHVIEAPVISVGNLTTGGTGKTPLVEWIAQRLAQSGRRVCILTRGYGRQDPHQRVVVSDGNQIVSSAAESGDEALMLAETLKGKAAVICDADRVAAAKWAIENLQSEVFVLDDGFQNLRTSRDLNLVTIDATNPWANQRVLPAGMLREPLTSLRRADCVVLTRVDTSELGLISEVRKVSQAIVLESRMVTSQLRPINSAAAQETNRFDFTSIAAFCGVGNPKAFFDQLKRDGINLVHTTAFRDHHNYSQSDVDRISREAKLNGAQALITSAKDEVKLRTMRFDLPCFVVEIRIEISSEEKLLELIEQAISTTGC